jgi:hypothetical protein
VTLEERAQKLATLVSLLQELQTESAESPDSLSLYFPRPVPENFYFDANGLRKLTTVDSSVFRRLLGIK